MHIVHILASLDTGGSQLVAAELAEAQAGEGHRITMIAAPGELSGRLRQAGCELLLWPLHRKRLSVLKYVPRLRRWLNAERPDLVHNHSRLPAWVLRLALRRAKHRPMVVSSVHGHYSVNRYSAIMTRADGVIAVSRSIVTYIRENYPGVADSKLTLIPLGVDAEQFPRGHQPDSRWRQWFQQSYPATQGKRLLVLPGRPSRLKGHTAFLRLLAALLKSGQAVHGLIIGPRVKPGSRYAGELEQQIQQLDLESDVSFTGQRDDMANWFAAADLVFNLTTKPEAFGRTMLESLAVGTGVVAWDYGGAHELLSRLFPAGLVAPGDEAALLATTEQLLAQPQQPDPADHYALESMTEATMNLYLSLLEQAA